MNSKLEKIENNIATLEIAVSPERFEEGMKKSYLKNVKKFNIPGFRKGKAPRQVIESYYGEGILFEDAINYVCPGAYDEAVKENNLEPVDRPEIDIVDISKEKGIIFKAEVAVKPEVTLGEYKGIEVEKKEYNVTDEDINKELETLRDKNARIIEVTDRAVKNGDITMIDFKGFVDEVQFEGGTAEGYKLEIGSGQFIPGFEEQLVGAEIGKEVDVKVTFPEEYRKADLSGKDAIFKVTVKEIKEKQLVDLDDEFAKDVSEFDTLEELKADIRKKKEEQAANQAKHDYEEELIKTVVEAAEINIPAVMIENQITAMLRDFDMSLMYQGLNLETYMKYMGVEEKSLRDSYRETALNRVKTQLVLEKIGKIEAIEASDEDVNAEVEKLAGQYKQDVEKFKKTLKEDDLSYIKEGIVVQNTIDFLIANSVEKNN